MTFHIKNRFEAFEPKNCDACSMEFMRQELVTIKLAGFNSVLQICEFCKLKNSEESYATAANILQDIAKIVEGKSTSSEERLDQIRALLEC